jgi:hypothetical protein
VNDRRESGVECKCLSKLSLSTASRHTQPYGTCLRYKMCVLPVVHLIAPTASRSASNAMWVQCEACVKFYVGAVQGEPQHRPQKAGATEVTNGDLHRQPAPHT